LAQSNGNISIAARLLGVSRPTLYTLLEGHHMSAPRETFRLERRTAPNLTARLKQNAHRGATAPTFEVGLGSHTGERATQRRYKDRVVERPQLN
jgi:excisionase family DNA binding protein